MKKFISIATIVIISLGSLYGCTTESKNSTENTTSKVNSETKSNSEEVDKTNSKTEVKEENMTEVENTDDKSAEIKEETSSQNNNKAYLMEISVYASDDNATTLTKVVRTVPVVDKKVAAAALAELKAKDPQGQYQPAVPESISFNGVSISDGLATVDFDNGGVSLGSAGESMFIESVVLTLTEFPTVQRVRFTLNGQVVESIGHMTLDKEFTRADISYAEVIN